MVRPVALANALATVVGAGYLLCRLAAAVAPDLLFRIGQSWLHTVNLAPLQTNSPMPPEMFLLGLVSSIVVSWVAGYATAELYRRWAR